MAGTPFQQILRFCLLHSWSSAWVLCWAGHSFLGASVSAEGDGHTCPLRLQWGPTNDWGCMQEAKD